MPSATAPAISQAGGAKRTGWGTAIDMDGGSLV
jgi:hypothetical protein